MRLTAAILVAGTLAGCVSAPPAPIDPGRTAERLTTRSLDDPRIARALTSAGLPSPQEAGWSLDSLTAAAWTLRPEVAAAAADVAAGNAAQRVAGQCFEEIPRCAWEPVTLREHGIEGADDPFLVRG